MPRNVRAASLYASTFATICTWPSSDAHRPSIASENARTYASNVTVSVGVVGSVNCAISPLMFGLEPLPLMICVSSASDSAMLTFWRSAASKLACPIAAMSSRFSVSRARMLRGFAVTAVSAAAVLSRDVPFATAAADSAVLMVISE